MQIDYPFQIDARSRTSLTSDDEHVRDLIEQVLFTSPGERLNRPDFGSSVSQLVFGPASDDVATTVQCVVQGALQQWLSEYIQVERVDVTTDDSTVRILVGYNRIDNQEPQVAIFEREVER